MPVPEGHLVEPNKPKVYSNLPEDKYQVMIYDVEELNEVSKFSGEEQRLLNFTFVILDDKKFTGEDEKGKEVEESTKGRRLWKRISWSFSPGGRFQASKFFELMCAIERRDLSKSDLSAVDPNTLIGQQLCVFVNINEKGYNQIQSFIKAQKDMEPLPTVFDKDESELEMKVKDEFKVKSTETVRKTSPRAEGEKEELF